MSLTVLISFAVVIVAGLMRGFAGVGSGMLMAPIFVALFGPVDTVAIIICMEIVVTVQLLPGVYKDIDWRVIGPMGFVAALFMPIGNWLLFSLDVETLSQAIGWIVLTFAILLMSGWRYRGKKHLPLTMTVGGLSGVLIASTSLGNPPVMMYLLSGDDKAAASRANFTGYFAITLLTLIALMTYWGLITQDNVITSVQLLPVFMISAWIGSRLFRKSNEALYRRIALGLLVFAGLYGVTS